MSRFKFSFWLNCKNDDELLVAELVDDLKRNRSFSSVVREGIVIINELRQGRIDTLLRLYPWVKDAIADMLPPPEPPPMPDNADLIEQFRRMLEQQQGRGIPDSRDAGLTLFKSIGADKAAPVAVIQAATTASADEIADNFFASYLQ
jgi:hypothetical protein